MKGINLFYHIQDLYFNLKLQHIQVILHAALIVFSFPSHHH